MGYRSQYKLEDVNPPHMRQTIKDHLSLLAYPQPRGNGPDVEGKALSPWLEDERWINNECKWYSCRKDAEEVAAAFPKASFTIARLGEDEYQWERRTYGPTVLPLDDRGPELVE